MKYGVTGATGALGSLVIQSLIDMKVPASSIIAVVRNRSKAEHLASQGVEIRIADYEQPETLEEALKGIDRLLLISGNEIGKRFRQHSNVITAAKKAGIKLLAYTSVYHADTSVSPVAQEHRETEEAIRKSGIPHVLLRNNWYTENYLDDVKLSGKTGVIEAAAGKGRVSSASRRDYAGAAAKVLAGEGHEGKIYELCGEPWDYNDLAKAASQLTGRNVVYKTVSADERTGNLLAAGLTPEIAGFVVAIDRSIEAGTLDGDSRDLENLLGRKPQSLLEGLKASLS